MEELSFLSTDQVHTVQQRFGTPAFVYDQKTLENQAQKVLAFPNAFGLTARYAMKACPAAGVVRILNRAPTNAQRLHTLPGRPVQGGRML